MHEEELYSSLQWDNPTSEASQKCLCPSKCSEHSIMPDMFTGMDELVKMKKKKGTGLWKYDIYSLSNLKKGTWCVMTVISCVFCVGLLATSIFLGIKFFQVSSLAMNQQERLIQQDRALLNLTEWQRNYTLQMRNCQALLQRSPRSGSNCIPCPHNWIQNGKSCYYAFHIWQIWNGSEKNCLKEDASLLQINSKDEMDFIIRSQWMRSGAEYWVGVFQDRFSQSWFWQDGSSLFSDLLPTARELSASQICGYFKDHSFFSDNCSSWKYFICEKNAFGSCI